MPAKRGRSQSMFSNVNGNEHTIDDMHLEFNEKYNSPNRGLKPSSERRLRGTPPKKLSACEKIHEELMLKFAEKKNK